jgi:hypothetical protein
MPTMELTLRMEALRMDLAKPHKDPEVLHDTVRVLIDDLHTHRDKVPVDLREAVESLEAEILEAFHDNLPL